MYLLFQECRAGHISERSHDMLAMAYLRVFNGFSTLYEYAAMPVGTVQVPVPQRSAQIGIV